VNGIRLNILAGAGVPLPLAPTLLEQLRSVKVETSDQGRSGFEIALGAGRGPTDLTDAATVNTPQLRPGSRIIVTALFGVTPTVLIDGIIATRELTPGSEPGTSTVTYKGQDISMAMDREERVEEHPAQPDPVIVLKIIARYAQYGLVPMIIPPPSLDVPNPVERTPMQRDTDLAYLRTLAGRYGYVFYINAGPLPGMNTAYWGPPPRVGIPQPALTFDMGPETNASEPSFAHDAETPTVTTGVVQDRQTNAALPIPPMPTTRPPLATERPTPATMRTRLQTEGGLSTSQALARAQASTDQSVDNAVQVTGTLDAVRYGRALLPRGLVGVRGVGVTHDGFYYVKSVTHEIERRGYKQKFVLTREGTGSTTPFVLP
jgi:hypothetical protein